MWFMIKIPASRDKITVWDHNTSISFYQVQTIQVLNSDKFNCISMGKIEWSESDCWVWISKRNQSRKKIYKNKSNQTQNVALLSLCEVDFVTREVLRFEQTTKKMHETSQMHLMDISRNVIFLFAVFLRRIGYQSAPIVLFVVRPIRISEFSSMFIDFREEMRLKFNFHRRKCRDLSTEIANLQTSGDFDSFLAYFLFCLDFVQFLCLIFCLS